MKLSQRLSQTIPEYAGDAAVVLVSVELLREAIQQLERLEQAPEFDVHQKFNVHHYELSNRPGTPNTALELLHNRIVKVVDIT